MLRLVLIGVAASLVAAPTASARDWTVDAIDWSFVGQRTTVDVGDSVTWRFTVAGHTSTSRDGQAESWNSAPSGSNAAGTTFTHVFTQPGRYEYICLPHRDFMTGVIEVRGATGESPPVLASLHTRRMRRGVRLRFRLNAVANVTYRLRGPSRRTIRRAGLGAGLHTIRVRRLRRGTYRGVLTAIDAAGKKTRRANSFRVR